MDSYPDLTTTLQNSEHKTSLPKLALGLGVGLALVIAVIVGLKMTQKSKPSCTLQSAKSSPSSQTTQASQNPSSQSSQSGGQTSSPPPVSTVSAVPNHFQVSPSLQMSQFADQTRQSVPEPFVSSSSFSAYVSGSLGPENFGSSQNTLQPYHDARAPAYETRVPPANILAQKSMMASSLEMQNQQPAGFGGSGGSSMSKSASMLNDQGFQQLASKNEPFVVAFVSNSCGHCHALKPNFEAAAPQARLPFYFLEVSQAGNLPQQLNINGYPTILKVQGQSIQMYSGDRSVASLQQFGS